MKRASKARCSGKLSPATSLAGPLRNQGRHSDAIACLHPVSHRFTEGFETANLIATKQLLDEPDVGCS